MKRTVLLTVATASLAAGVALRGASEQPSTKGEKPMLKAVVHVNFSDTDRQKHGLKNIANILQEAKGAAEIVVVCHGGGIELVVEDHQHAAEVRRLIKEGVRFAACENTLRDKSISTKSLLPGVGTVPSGAVEVIRKQEEGYGYFRP